MQFDAEPCYNWHPLHVDELNQEKDDNHSILMTESREGREPVTQFKNAVLLFIFIPGIGHEHIVNTCKII